MTWFAKLSAAETISGDVLHSRLRTAREVSSTAPSRKP